MNGIMIINNGETNKNGIQYSNIINFPDNMIIYIFRIITLIVIISGQSENDFTVSANTAFTAPIIMSIGKINIINNSIQTMI